MRDRLYSIWLIAQRDWLEATSTKMFWVGVLLMPIATIALGVFAALAVTFTSNSATVGSYAVLDRSENNISLEIRNEILRSDLSSFMYAISAPTPVSIDEQIFEELRSKIEDSSVLETVDSVMEYLKYPASDRSTDTERTLEGRFSQWWRSDQNQDRIVSLAPQVSFARYKEFSLPNLSERTLNASLRNEFIVGYFIIPQDFMNSNAGAKFVTENILKQDLADWYESYATRVIQNRRFEEANISRETAMGLLQRASFRTSKAVTSAPASDQAGSLPGEPEESSREVTAWETAGEFAPAIYQYILFFLVFIGATILMTNTVEEKSTKLVEVILSDLDPGQLMDGKLVGSALTLLTVVGFWIFLISLPLTVGAGSIMTLLPAAGEILEGGVLYTIFNPWYVINFVIFFVLGFAFYGYLLSAVGAVCSNVREAQMLAWPVNLMAIVPLLVMVPIAMDKTGGLASIMSWIPPFTPFVMMNIVGEIALLNYVVILAWMIAVTLGVRWLAKKVYTRGILLENKPAGIKGLVALVSQNN